MSRANIELADLFREHREDFLHLPPQEQKVMNAITNCRTEVLGGHLLKCGSCSYQKNAYNSCRNRHCPKCQFLTKVKWVEKRKSELLPCSYFHVVFTVPEELRDIFRYNNKVCYDLLFKTTSETLKEVARIPKNLGAEIGFIGVLHTWSQSLIYHPHVHYIVPTGGLRLDKWIKGKDDYFLCTKILSSVFRAKMFRFEI